MDKALFVKLNQDWNAEPNDPGEEVSVHGDIVRLSFFLNPWTYEADEGHRGVLTFTGSRRWRLGPTNDEGWLRGDCRYSATAPEWGEFYEISGLGQLESLPTDWQDVLSDKPGKRHFLFYLRDNTFECLADDWSFER